MARKVDVGEFVIITKKNDDFFGKIGLVSDQDGDNWFVTIPGWRYTEIYKKSNLKVITNLEIEKFIFKMEENNHG